jgi:hypothetical protein
MHWLSLTFPLAMIFMVSESLMWTAYEDAIPISLFLA